MPMNSKNGDDCTDESVEERLGTSVEHMTNQLDPSNFYARVFTQCLRFSRFTHRHAKTGTRSKNRKDGNTTCRR